MSSPKNYILEISPESPQESDSLIKFVVKPPPSKLQHVRWPIFFLLVGVLTKYVLQEIRASEITNWIKIAVLVVLVAIIILKQQPQDLITVIRDLGVQLNSESGWRYFRKSSDFIPLSNIIDLVIHEGFHGYGQVIFYMCILTKSLKGLNMYHGEEIDGSPIKVVFPQLLPRQDILVEVWKKSRGILFGDRRRYWRRVPGQGLREVY